MLGALNTPQWVKSKWENPDTDDEETKYFRIGSALDTLLTAPSTFKDEFDVINVDRPSGLLGKFIDNLPIGVTLDSPEERFYEAYDKSGYKAKLSTVLKWFEERKEAWEYYQAINQLDRDKSIISKDELELVENMKYLVLCNPFIYDYFMNVGNKDIELIHQLPVYFTCQEIECKALLDGIKIDHKAKTIQPFDLKTIGKGVWNFSMSFYQYGYYRQAAFYTYALELWVKEHNLQDYNLLPFQFVVVESKKSSRQPAIVYQCSPSDLRAGKEGGCLKQWNDKCLKGYIELLEDWKWHLEKDYWLMPRDLYQQEGKLNLDIFI